MSKTITIDLIKPHETQLEFIEHPARYKIAACGRRWGKTEAGKIMLIKKAVFEGKRVWWLSPTYQAAASVWRAVKLAVRETPHEKIESERNIYFWNGGYIGVRSTHEFQNLRGEGLDDAIFDEFAQMHPDVWPEVIRPMLMTTGGGAAFLSTPFGLNLFWELFKRGVDPLEKEYQSFHFPTSANPIIPSSEIEAAKRTMPSVKFRQEIMAEFMTDGGSVFRRVHDNATLEGQAQPEQGKNYIFGVDWAKDNDFTVIAVVDTETGHIVHIERFNEIGWRVQRGRLAALHDLWKPSLIVAEANSIGSVNIEELQAQGFNVMPFTMTAKSKPPLIESLSLAFERDEIKLPRDTIVISEFISYQVERLPGGLYRYNAVSGGHDDIVIAVALAWYGKTMGVVSVDFI